MGDAGAGIPIEVQLQNGVAAPGVQSTLNVPPPREINILVTGFGPFKSFATNPSYLIASALPQTLDPATFEGVLKQHYGQLPLRPPNLGQYKINIHVYPHSVRVAYASTATLIPRLIARSMSSSSSAPSSSDELSGMPTVDYDYILHIGMAGGRDNYTLETVAHRDSYKIKDVDERDGFMPGEFVWKREGTPEVLQVGWNKMDVLHRWETLTRVREEEYETMEIAKARQPSDMPRALVLRGKGKRAAVALSKDAGRFLCEFIQYTSMSTRWKQARAEADEEQPSVAVRQVRQDQSHGQRAGDPAREKIGKVAFLHVPGGVELHDITRGVRVAESAILALIGSWESGYRNPDVYGGLI